MYFRMIAFILALNSWNKLVGIFFLLAEVDRKLNVDKSKLHFILSVVHESKFNSPKLCKL